MLQSGALIVLLLEAAVVISDCARGRRSIPDGAFASLTPLISLGNIKEAQDAAYVNPPLFGVKSYAHYLTVNETYNSNLFFWYFPVTTADPKAPLVLWLQGGPGSSSLLGLFAEHGPVSIDANLKAIPRDFAWNKRYNMLYVDNPVGTGFSYTDNDDGYSNDMDDVGTNLYAALIQFLTLFPDLQQKSFFITGESYAGKYIPALGHYIHNNNPNASLKVNLAGLAIGNGFSDPPNMMDYSSHLFQIGLIDEYGKIQFEIKQAEIQSLIEKEDWESAAYVLSTMMVTTPPQQPYKSLFTNLTGFTNVYNYLNQTEPIRYWITYVTQAEIRKSIHVYDRTLSDGVNVRTHFLEEMLKSVKPWVEELLGTYRVLIYTGQLDCDIPPKQVHDYTKTLQFPGMVDYHSSPRYKWLVGDRIGGYVRTGGLLTDVMVRDSGHMIPQDQPELAWDLIDRFINNKTFEDAP